MMNQLLCCLLCNQETPKLYAMKKIELMHLPFHVNALEPHIGKSTLEFHYGKHHNAYVEKLNKLIEGSNFEKMTLDEIVKNSDGVIFNNAAQVWNHNFYWNCLSPENKKGPMGSLKIAIEKEYGNFENFKSRFNAAAMELFGSGWVWLVKNEEGKLEIIKTANAGNPICEDKIPLLVCDVWEHAYYLDRQNRRAEYLEHFWELANWENISERY